MDSNQKERLVELYWELLSRYDLYKEGQIPEIRVDFYPYTTIKNTVRKRKNTIYVRISDMLEDAPQDVLLALKTVDAEIREKIHRNLPREDLEPFRQDFEQLGRVRLREVEAAQQRIIGHIRSLEESGAIVVARPDEVVD